MSVCRVYTKAGHVIELHGSGFSVTRGTMENDVRKLAWKEMNSKKSDVLYLDVSNIEAVVVSDK